MRKLEMRRKSEASGKAAQLMEQKGFFDAAVNRWYYSVFQRMLDYVHSANDPAMSRADPTGEASGTHKKFAEMIGQNLTKRNLDGKEFFRAYDSLRIMRKKADYDIKPLDQEAAIAAERHRNRIIQILDSKTKESQKAK